MTPDREAAAREVLLHFRLLKRLQAALRRDPHDRDLRRAAEETEAAFYAARARLKGR